MPWIINEANPLTGSDEKKKAKLKKRSWVRLKVNWKVEQGQSETLKWSELKRIAFGNGVFASISCKKTEEMPGKTVDRETKSLQSESLLEMENKIVMPCNTVILTGVKEREESKEIETGVSRTSSFENRWTVVSKQAEEASKRKWRFRPNTRTKWEITHEQIWVTFAIESRLNGAYGPMSN
jgi:hypothetical protein